MKPEAYTAAAKKVAGHKSKENYMEFSLSYDKRLIVPYKDGQMIIEALKNAEMLLGQNYSTSVQRLRTITPDDDVLTYKLISHQQVQNYRIATLLNVSLKDVQDAADKAAEEDYYEEEIPF